MRGLILLTLLFTTSLSGLAQAQDKSVRQVLATLDAQKESWNKGDILGFMKSYWNDPQLQFISATGVTKGWEATLERYQNTYPDREAMGHLEFKVIQTDRRSKKLVTVSGKYILTRDNKNLVGYFLLVWEKKGKEWFIVMDATT